MAPRREVNAAMTDFGLQNFDHAVASIGEADADCRASIVAALRRMGLRDVRAHATMNELLGSAADADIISETAARLSVRRVMVCIIIILPENRVRSGRRCC